MVAGSKLCPRIISFLTQEVIALIAYRHLYQTCNSTVPKILCAHRRGKLVGTLTAISQHALAQKSAGNVKHRSGTVGHRSGNIGRRSGDVGHCSGNLGRRSGTFLLLIHWTTLRCRGQLHLQTSTSTQVQVIVQEYCSSCSSTSASTSTSISTSTSSKYKYTGCGKADERRRGVSPPLLIHLHHSAASSKKYGSCWALGTGTPPLRRVCISSHSHLLVSTYTAGGRVRWKCAVRSATCVAAARAMFGFAAMSLFAWAM
mmetsp:Transcript_2914/g.4904  ORF Transcript_2914/g.4904 Transcript_2914/m.4904 type:complete len:258 (+) Transcript_2914:445-1218(+)